MTAPAPTLTEAELDSMSNMRANLWPFGWVNRVIAQARRALTLESDLAQLRAFIGHVADGGSIVSTAAMTPTQIAVARAAERMFVTQDGLGFVYVPGPRFCACGRLESDCDQSRAACKLLKLEALLATVTSTESFSDDAEKLRRIILLMLSSARSLKESDEQAAAIESELAQLRREKAELESVHQTLRKKVESAIRNIGDIVDTENGERHTVPLWVRDMLGKALRGEP